MATEKPLTDGRLIAGLLDLSAELLIKGDPDNSWLCTSAAARIMAIPSIAQAIGNQHPNPKFDIDKTVELIFGVTPPAREERTDG